MEKSNREGQVDSDSPVVTPTWLTSFPVLLLVTWASALVGELSYVGIRAIGLDKLLPVFLVVPLPPSLSGAVFPWLVTRLVYRRSFRQMGVRMWDASRSPWKWLVGSASVSLVVWFLFWLVALGALSTLGPSQRAQLHLSAAELDAHNPLYQLVHGRADANAAAIVLHMSVLVGFIEEWLGRGLVQNALDQHYPQVWGRGRLTVRKSTVLAALLFGAWHIRWLTLAPLGIQPFRAIFISALTSLTVVLVPSFLLCFVYEKSRSLLVTMLVHDVIDGGKLLTWLVCSAILGA